jgi:hypothetical protein
VQSFESQLRKQARTYESMHEHKIPEGRWNLADQRHLCGAF